MHGIEIAGRGRFRAAGRGKVAVLLVGLGIVTTAAAPVPTETLQRRLVGVYTLTRYSAHGDNPRGRIAYDDSGRMWVMLLPPDRKPLYNSSAPEEYRDTMRRVVAYYGTYEIDEPAMSVIHHVQEASNPAWIGENFRRWYFFRGEDLIFSLNPDFDDPLMWRRLPDTPVGSSE